MRKHEKTALKIALIISVSGLLYIVLTFPLDCAYKKRLVLFSLQHFLTLLFSFLQIVQVSDDYSDSTIYLLYWAFGNLCQFCAVEIFLAFQPQDLVPIYLTLHQMPQVIQIYIHFYFQVNIYLGIFSVLSVFIMIFQKIHDMSQLRSAKIIQDKLSKYQYSATEQDQNCSICLNQYKLGEKNLYKLHCKHIFHQECLKSWLKQKKNCPLCRDTEFVEQ